MSVEDNNMRRSKEFLIILLFLQSIICTGREFYITPDGETVYYSPQPRVFVYKPKAEKKRQDLFIPNGNEPRAVTEPTGLFIDRNDRIYISDAGRNAVNVFSPRGDFLKTMIHETGDSRTLHRPGPLAMNPFGDLFIIDTETRDVLCYDFSGRLISPLETPANKGRQIDSPSAIAITPAGDIFVADAKKCRILHFSFKRELIGAWGEAGSANGQLGRPGGIASGVTGELYVTDTENHRVQVFQPDGTLAYFAEVATKAEKWLFGQKGSRWGDLSLPSSIAVNHSGILAVVDSSGGRIQLFTPLGKFLGGVVFDRDKEGLPEVRADAIAFDSIGSLYILDGRGRRILKVFPHEQNAWLKP